MKSVNKEEFWADRLQKAEKEHYSVFVCGEKEWEVLNEAHNDIIKKFVSGKVLDAGCGYGRMSPLFEDYTGVDFASCFIDKAKKEYPDKEFVQAKLEDLPFDNKEFDWAICVSIKKMISANEGVEKWILMQTELKRVANKILILEYSDPGNYEIL